jgi:hypothetical protein
LISVEKQVLQPRRKALKQSFKEKGMDLTQRKKKKGNHKAKLVLETRLRVWYDECTESTPVEAGPVKKQGLVQGKIIGAAF